jgi:hypothetical protein
VKGEVEFWAATTARKKWIMVEKRILAVVLCPWSRVIQRSPKMSILALFSGRLEY